VLYFIFSFFPAMIDICACVLCSWNVCTCRTCILHVCGVYVCPCVCMSVRYVCWVVLHTLTNVYASIIDTITARQIHVLVWWSVVDSQVCWQTQVSELQSHTQAHILYTRTQSPTHSLIHIHARSLTCGIHKSSICELQCMCNCIVICNSISHTMLPVIVIVSASVVC